MGASSSAPARATTRRRPALGMDIAPDDDGRVYRPPTPVLRDGSPAPEVVWAPAPAPSRSDLDWWEGNDGDLPGGIFVNMPITFTVKVGKEKTVIDAQILKYYAREQYYTAQSDAGEFFLVHVYTVAAGGVAAFSNELENYAVLNKKLGADACGVVQCYVGRGKIDPLGTGRFLPLTVMRFDAHPYEPGNLTITLATFIKYASKRMTEQARRAPAIHALFIIIMREIVDTVRRLHDAGFAHRALTTTTFNLVPPTTPGYYATWQALEEIARNPVVDPASAMQWTGVSVTAMGLGKGVSRGATAEDFELDVAALGEIAQALATPFGVSVSNSPFAPVAEAGEMSLDELVSSLAYEETLVYEAVRAAQ